MKIDFSNSETFSRSGGNLQLATRLRSMIPQENFDSLITTSDKVSGIELRMLAPLIKDNRTPRIPPFPGFAKLYCLTIVVSDATNQLVGAIDLKSFPRIGDNEELPINKTIFYWQAENMTDKSPNQIHVISSVIKSKESLRNVGEILSGIKGDSGYKNLVSNLGSLIKDASKFNVVTDLVMEIAGIAGKYMGHVEDKPLGTVINSYTTLHGDFDKSGINQLKNITKYVDFNFQLIVRDNVGSNGAGAPASDMRILQQHSDDGDSVLTEEDVIVEMVPL